MVRFGSALLAPGFLSGESRRLLFESMVLADGKSTGYGMGWFAGSDSLGHRVNYHGGSSIGGTAMLSLHPDQRVVVAVLVNTTASRFVNGVTERLAHLFVDASRSP